jgi:hypothetical protein
MPKKSTKKKSNFGIPNFRESSLQYQAVVLLKISIILGETN